MKIELHPQFKRSYKIRIAKNSELVVRTAKRLKLFQENPQNPIIKDHLLKGRKRNFRAFWVTGDIRIIYIKTSRESVILLNIGTHNQIY